MEFENSRILNGRLPVSCQHVDVEGGKTLTPPELDFGELGDGTVCAEPRCNTERAAAMSNFVETWKGIAFALGRSERWCRYMARRDSDPLPVFKVGGIVRLNEGDLNDWLSRQRERSLGTRSESAIRLIA